MGPKPLAAAAGRAILDVAPVSPGRMAGMAPAYAVAASASASPDGARRGAEPAIGDTSAASWRAPELPSFEDLYDAQFDFVWRSLLLLGVAAYAVEDATQEVFSVVSRQLGKFEGRSSVRTWLFAILQRVAANQRRTERRKQRPLEPLEEGAACGLPTPHARLEVAESIGAVQRFCAMLDPERRAVFVLALLEELPAPEVSQALGIPVNTVYSRVRSLREGLRRMLDEEEARRG